MGGGAVISEASDELMEFVRKAVSYTHLTIRTGYRSHNKEKYYFQLKSPNKYNIVLIIGFSQVKYPAASYRA